MRPVVKRHYLLIDTSVYAGNVDRLLCAAVTGMALEESASDEVKAVARAYDGPDMSEWIRVESDKHGRPRYAWCDRTPGTEVCNTVRIALEEELDPKTLLNIDARARAAAQKGFTYAEPFQIIGVRTVYEEPLPRDKLT